MGYQVYVVGNSSDHDILRFAEPGTGMHELYHKTMEGNPKAFVDSCSLISSFKYKDNISCPTHEEVVTNIFHSNKSDKALFYGGEFQIMALFDDLKFLNIQGLLNVNKENSKYTYYYLLLFEKLHMICMY